MKHILPSRRAVAIVLLALSLTAASGPGGKPEEVGLSSERLQRINDVVKSYIDSGQISGAVTMVSRKGRIAHFEAQGLMDEVLYVVLVDDRSSRPSLDNSFGTGLQEAVDLMVTPHIMVWTDPPPADAALTDWKPPTHVDLTLTLMKGEFTTQ